MTESASLLTQLGGIGIPPDEAEDIAHDITSNDARSLFSALMLRGLWKLVVDETDPSELSRLGLPAVDRLLKAGMNLDDLLDVVRETQVNLIYNVALLIDWPTETQELPDALEPELSVRFPEAEGPSLPVYELQSCLELLDPTGRGGAPRSLEMRHFQALPGSARAELLELIRGKQFSAAALKWKAHVGGELRTCLSAVQALHNWLHALKA